MSIERIRKELSRLANGLSLGEGPDGAGTVRFIASCPFGAAEVLERVKTVLRIVDEAAITGRPMDKLWKATLPDWFVARCAPPNSQEESGRNIAWRKNLPPDEEIRIAREMDWTLDAWLYWLEPDRREWFWWDAKALVDLDHIIIAVEVDSWPFPWGALRWLFLAAGAADLSAEE